MLRSEVRQQTLLIQCHVGSREVSTESLHLPGGQKVSNDLIPLSDAYKFSLTQK